MVPQADGPEPPADANSRHGAAQVAVDTLLLVRTALPWFTAGLFWSLVVICAGVLLVVSARRT